MMSKHTEIIIRLGMFGGVLFLMVLWELLTPRRRLTVRKAPRWASNLGLVAINVFLARLLIPVTAAGSAVVAESRGWGILHLVDWPAWLELILAVLAFDLAIYLQHVISMPSPPCGGCTWSTMPTST